MYIGPSTTEPSGRDPGFTAASASHRAFPSKRSMSTFAADRPILLFLVDAVVALPRQHAPLAAYDRSYAWEGEGYAIAAGVYRLSVEPSRQWMQQSTRRNSRPRSRYDRAPFAVMRLAVMSAKRNRDGRDG